MARNVAVVYTGGTAGMRSTERGLAPVSGEEFARLFSTLPGLNDRKLPDFVLRPPSVPVMDSASMRPRDWVRLANDVATSYGEFDGFVLIVGTDTMSYAASALSFFLEGLCKPVVLTGAQYPIGHNLSDAPANLLGALHVVQQAEGLSEVTIFFNGLLIRGNRAEKVDASEPNAIISPRFPTLGVLQDGVLSLRRDLLLPVSGRPLRMLDSAQGLPHVSCLRLFPGMDTDLLAFALRPAVQGLILETYGSGNAANDVGQFAVLERACKRGVVVVNST